MTPLYDAKVKAIMTLYYSVMTLLRHVYDVAMTPHYDANKAFL